VATKTKSKSSTKSSSKTKTSVQKNQERINDSLVEPVHVDSVTAVDKGAATIGNFGRIVKGEHSGRYGVVEEGLDPDPKTGYPRKVRFRTRDDESEYLVVPYSDVRRAVAGGR
jgi:hypothetical protein